jgi:hypothetical protein
VRNPCVDHEDILWRADCLEWMNKRSYVEEMFHISSANAQATCLHCVHVSLARTPPKDPGIHAPQILRLALGALPI